MLGNILDGYQDFSISTTAAEEQFYKVVTRNAFCNFQNMLLLCLDDFYAMLLGNSYLFLKVSVQAPSLF